MKYKLSYKRLAFHSLLSRIFYISISTLSHYFIPHYDLSFNLNDSSSIFNSLLKWDAVHFRDIALNGYLQEHTLAFFPLLPSIIRTFHFIINKIFLLHNVDLFTVGIILINLMFIINSLLLYKLTLHIFDYEMAMFSFYLYIFNPASIVCSSMYTETLFMLIFLISLFLYIKKKEIQCTLILSLSILCRSNGILFALLLYKFRMFLVHLVVLCIPIGFQQLYCLSKILVEKFSIFIPYSYIQKEYWNQGFLRYFHSSHIEHILLNLPFILFFIYSIYYNRPLRDDLKKTCKKENTKGLYDIFISLEILLFLQTISTIFFFYWSIYFRFISYNPVVYWIIASMYINNRNYTFRKFLRFYLFYSVRYALSFGAFYEPI